MELNSTDNPCINTSLCVFAITSFLILLIEKLHHRNMYTMYSASIQLKYGSCAQIRHPCLLIISMKIHAHEIKCFQQYVHCIACNFILTFQLHHHMTNPL